MYIVFVTKYRLARNSIRSLNFFKKLFEKKIDFETFYKKIINKIMRHTDSICYKPMLHNFVTHDKSKTFISPHQ